MNSIDINLFVNDNSTNSNIIYFCRQSKKINFIPQELKNFSLVKNKNNLIVLKEDVLMSDLIKQMKRNFIVDSTSLCFFLQTQCKANNLFVDAAKINYPIKFVDFESKILKIFATKKNLFNNLELKHNNTLYNIKNKKQIHLTEIESGIIKLLFAEQVVNKKILNLEVLNHSVLIDSKSLDSHLYRLRKKLYKVDTKTKIVSIDNQSLKII
tara:strand:- start:298 stop:930 length:633 start_codon:yes stop_codon:yes gene_type:complete